MDPQPQRLGSGVRSWAKSGTSGSIENTQTAIRRLGRRITRQHGIAEFVRDTASCGYNEQRQPRSEP